MSWRDWKLVRWILRTSTPLLPTRSHLRLGAQGEQVAEDYLSKRGMKLLVRNFRAGRGEIDLIMREKQCLIFIEVKTRSSEEWSRPAAAVNAQKRKILSRTALAYLALLNNPSIPFRFDIVEVLMEERTVREIRHLPNAFRLSDPYRYGW